MKKNRNFAVTRPSKDTLRQVHFECVLNDSLRAYSAQLGSQLGSLYHRNISPTNFVRYNWHSRDTCTEKNILPTYFARYHRHSRDTCTIKISHQLTSWDIMDYHWLSSITIDYHGLSWIIMDYHWLSLIIIDYHWLSLIVIDYHWLSLNIIDYHWLSLIIIDYHWLSLIIIDFHWLSSTHGSEHLKELDAQVKSMMEKSQNMVQHGKQKRTAEICKVCGKEGAPEAIKDHIEANHLVGVSLPCDHCDRTFRSRYAIRRHKCTY